VLCIGNDSVAVFRVVYSNRGSVIGTQGFKKFRINESAFFSIRLRDECFRGVDSVCRSTWLVASCRFCPVDHGRGWVVGAGGASSVMLEARPATVPTRATLPVLLPLKRIMLQDGLLILFCQFLHGRSNLVKGVEAYNLVQQPGF